MVLTLIILLPMTATQGRFFLIYLEKPQKKKGGGGEGKKKKKATEQENTHKYSTSHLLYLGEFFSWPVSGHKIPKATTFSKESN